MKKRPLSERPFSCKLNHLTSITEAVKLSWLRRYGLFINEKLVNIEKEVAIGGIPDFN